MFKGRGDHRIQRAWERYGCRLDLGDIERIEERIRGRGKGVMLVRTGTAGEGDTWAVTYHDVTFVAVVRDFGDGRGLIVVTFLDPDVCTPAKRKERRFSQRGKGNRPTGLLRQKILYQRQLRRAERCPEEA